ncbi:MAG: response regulator [Candidatus Scalindua sp.]
MNKTSMDNKEDLEMCTPIRVLMIEDSEDDAALIMRELERNGYEVMPERVDTQKAMEDSLDRQEWDVIIADYSMPQFDAVKAFKLIRERKLDLPFILVSGVIGEDVAVEAMKVGVHGYVMKDNLARLCHAVERALREVKKQHHIKQIEVQLQKLSRAVEYSPSSIVITDTSGKIEYVNPKFTMITGYTAEEAIGQSPSIMKSGKQSVALYKELWNTITSGKEWRGELCNRKKNGELYWESVSISSVNNEEGRIVNYVAVKEDITERKKSERRLNAQHAVTQVLAESATLEEAAPRILQAICEALEWDLGEIWVYDQQQCALRNTEIWHLPSLKFSEFKDATKQTTFSPKIGLPGRVWESAEPLWIEDVVLDPNFLRASIADKVGLHGAFGFPIIIGSEVLGIICFFSREIREPDKDLLDMMTAIGRQIGLFIKRKQAEEALLQSEKLKSIGTITAGISHEFNNLLAIISGNVQLLEVSRKDDKELMGALRTIKRAANDGAEISSKMLKFTKTDKGTAGFVPIDINELINQAIDFTTPRWKNMAQAKGINYHMDTEGMKRAPSILCNPTEIREVFVNIINNALDAMPDGGTITVKTRRVRSKEFARLPDGQGAGSEELGKLKDDFVEITFADTGEGMSVEVKKNIFDPFFTTKIPVGTGLGMSMAYGIITRHGGKIEVESAVGRGSTFILQFPAAAETGRPEESPEPKQEIKTNSLRILVVDDNERICNILDIFFSKKGHLVRTVDNGREAIILAKNDDYDLVLCDLAMPNVYGYDVIKALNDLEKRPKIGIITGWGEKLKPIDDEDLKVDFIIKKPFDFSELTKNINNVINE